MLIRSGVTVSVCHNFCLFIRFLSQCLTNRSQFFYSVTSRNETFTHNFDNKWSRFTGTKKIAKSEKSLSLSIGRFSKNRIFVKTTQNALILKTGIHGSNILIQK